MRGEPDLTKLPKYAQSVADEIERLSALLDRAREYLLDTAECFTLTPDCDCRLCTLQADLEAEREHAEPPVSQPTDLLHWAWTIIANANGGNWELASDEWREAAERWRDAYHAQLDEREHAEP